MRYNDAYDMQLHKDDHWVDEIWLCGETAPLLRLVTRPRYKTSGLSGDEWRTSTVWQCSMDMAPRLQGDLAAYGADSSWLDFDGHYGNRLAAGCAALFPGLWGNQRNIHDVPIHAVDFLRKGRTLYRSTYDGQPMALLVCAGHLPWALVCANDAPLGTTEAWDDMQRLCFQPGCASPAVSTYKLRTLYDSKGNQSSASAMRYILGAPPTPVGLIRRFCRVHLRRGDCGREDAEKNYEVLEGPGPEQAQGWQAYQSPSISGRRLLI